MALRRAGIHLYLCHSIWASLFRLPLLSCVEKKINIQMLTNTHGNTPRIHALWSMRLTFMFLVGLNLPKGLIQSKSASSKYNHNYFLFYSRCGISGRHNLPPLWLHVPVQYPTGLLGPPTWKPVHLHQTTVLELVESQL